VQQIFFFRLDAGGVIGDYAIHYYSFHFKDKIGIIFFSRRRLLRAKRPLFVDDPNTTACDKTNKHFSSQLHSVSMSVKQKEKKNFFDNESEMSVKSSLEILKLRAGV
jgi:hypothetical protein